MKKNMITKGLYALTLLAVSLLSASCSSDSDNNVTLPKKVSVTVTATAVGATRTTLSEAAGTTSDWLWSTGDKLYVVDATNGVIGALTLSSGADSNSGTFTGDIAITTGTTYRFWYLGTGNSVSNNASTFTLDLSSQSGASADLGKYDVMTASGSFDVNYSVSLTLSKQLCIVHAGVTSTAGDVAGLTLSGTGVKNSVVFNLKDNATPTAADGTITLSATYTSPYIALYPGTLSPVFKATVNSILYTTASTLSWPLLAGNLYRGSATSSGSTVAIACNTVYVPTGALPGLFSVSATKQVYFSKGNLQYVPFTGIWSFHDNQYDYCEGNGATTRYTAAGTDPIDLFGFATSGLEVNGASYAPYMTSTTGTDYATAITTDGTTLTGTYANWDWGANAISNGGNTAGQWRTLTNDEWSYLFSTRTGAASKRGLATLTGISVAGNADVEGLVVLPDTWTLPGGLSFTVTTSNFTTNSYTATQWSLMEAAGALFLPAAGGRSGTSVNGTGTYGGYWSSTANSSCYAYNVTFYAGSLTPAGDYNRYYGRCVRLAQDK